MKKISSIIVLLLLFVICITGCSSNSNSSSTTSSSSSSSISSNSSSSSSSSSSSKKIDSYSDLTSKSGRLTCTREAEITDGSGDFEYIVSYKNDILTSIYSVESVTIDNEEKLQEYIDAYKAIKKNYKGLDYYEINIITEGNTVINATSIDYTKVDIDKLISIEGEEDNIFDNGKPTMKKWFKLFSQFGVTCTED